MDTRTLISNLNRIFCELSKQEKKYTLVWLEEEDFGGLYYSGKFILRVLAHQNIENCLCEISIITAHLAEVAPEELKCLWRVSVKNHKSGMYRKMDIDEYLVYSESAA